METTALVKLVLIGYGVAGIVYACMGSGFIDRGRTRWWDELPKPKKIVFTTAIAASLLQMFL